MSGEFFYSVGKDENGEWRLVKGYDVDVWEQAHRFGSHVSAFAVPHKGLYAGVDIQKQIKDCEKRYQTCLRNMRKMAEEGRINTAFNEIFEAAEVLADSFQYKADLFFLGYKGGDVSQLVKLCEERAKVYGLCCNEAKQIDFFRKTVGEKGIKACIKALKEGLPTYEDDEDD